MLDIFQVVLVRHQPYLSHDDVIKWKHFPRYWPFVRGIHRSPVNSPHKCQWRGALMFSLICVWINGWLNNREAGDQRRYRAHYDVIVMWPCTNTVWGFKGKLSLSLYQTVDAKKGTIFTPDPLITLRRHDHWSPECTPNDNNNSIFIAICTLAPWHRRLQHPDSILPVRKGVVHMLCTLFRNKYHLTL